MRCWSTARAPARLWARPCQPCNQPSLFHPALMASVTQGALALTHSSVPLQGARRDRCLFRARGGLRHAAQSMRLAAVAASAAEPQHARRLLVSFTVAVPLLAPLFAALPTVAAEEEGTTFYGAAKPPASYGGVGGTDKANARYSLFVPSTFTEIATSKVEKGSQGIDAKFAGPRKASIRVVTLKNEGARDGLVFTLRDPDSALKSVSGSDFTLQDALAAGEVKSAKRGDGFTFDVTGPTCLAMALSTTTDGRLFCVIVSAPSSAWAANESLYKTIRDSFQTYLLPE